MGQPKTDLRLQVRSALEGFPNRPFRHESKGAASVLIALSDTTLPTRILLTRRSLAVSTHQGEVAFPGGRRDPRDANLRHTALRETHEEVGIPPHKFEVVGRLNDYLSITRWRVTPFVSFLTKQCRLQPNPAEVARAFWVPLSFFGHHTPRVEERERLGQIRRVHFYDYEGEVIWGLTARILLDLLEALPWPAGQEMPDGEGGGGVNCT